MLLLLLTIISSLDPSLFNIQRDAFEELRVDWYARAS